VKDVFGVSLEQEGVWIIAGFVWGFTSVWIGLWGYFNGWWGKK